MRGNQNHSGLVPVRWSDGTLLYRRTWSETVSTLNLDLLGYYCPGQGRLKPVAGQAAGPEALVGPRQTWEPQAPDVPGDAPRMAVDRFIVARRATQAESLLAAPDPYAKDLT